MILSTHTTIPYNSEMTLANKEVKNFVDVKMAEGQQPETKRGRKKADDKEDDKLIEV